MKLRAQNSRLIGDSPRLQQVFWNLLKNASKFTPEGGEIEVSSIDEDNTIRVAVRDTGIGLETNQLTEVSEPFRQGSAAITKQYGGLGLGLAISKATVEQPGGTIKP